jgi:protein-L-isoaspartate(D-aspartate) O-methyltransferase
MTKSERLRRNLVRELKIAHPAVRDAFLAVPREIFLPEVAAAQGLEVIYDNRVFVTKQDSRGQAISSSSQPGIMAPMLELLDARPADRVLEIGAGTGYNAALLKHIVGRRGRVTTLEIDPDTAKRASRALRRARSVVSVRTADGHKGWRDGGPYDRIIATASTDEIPRAWFRDLIRGGMLVVPVRIATDSFGPQLVVAFHRDAKALVSTKVVAGGFMTMRDAPGADAATFPGVHIQQRARGKTSYVAAVGGAIDRMIPVARRRLLVTMARAPRTTRLAAGPTRRMVGLGAFVALGADPRRRVEGAGWSTGIVGADGRTAAFTGGTTRDGRTTFRVYGYGSRAGESEFRALVREWTAAGRPSLDDLRISVGFTKKPPSAWRTTRRGASWMTFEWAADR